MDELSPQQFTFCGKVWRYVQSESYAPRAKAKDMESIAQVVTGEAQVSVQLLAAASLYPNSNSLANWR